MKDASETLPTRQETTSSSDLVAVPYDPAAEARDWARLMQPANPNDPLYEGVKP